MNKHNRLYVMCVPLISTAAAEWMCEEWEEIKTIHSGKTVPANCSTALAQLICFNKPIEKFF